MAIKDRMKNYQAFLLTDTLNEYGERTTNKENILEIRMSISRISTAIDNNLPYSEAEFIGLTSRKDITDKFYFSFGDKTLKVLYVVPDTRYTQVFLKEVKE